MLPDGADKAWLSQRLRPLLGLETSPATLEESFAAWRAFLVHIAGSGPTVIVLEDLHWADEALLAFLDGLAADPPATPLLILSTTRPELVQRRPDTLRTAKNVAGAPYRR